jgi:hypothetical protein
MGPRECPPSLFELWRGLAVALRAEAEACRGSGGRSPGHRHHGASHGHVAQRLGIGKRCGVREDLFGEPHFRVGTTSTNGCRMLSGCVGRRKPVFLLSPAGDTTSGIITLMAWTVGTLNEAVDAELASCQRTCARDWVEFQS